MDYHVTLLIAVKQVNDILSMFDLKPSYKCFISDTLHATISTQEALTPEIFYTVIEESKKDRESPYWFPAIEFNEVLYVDKEIKELSYGDKVIFIQGEIM